ncbi:MAG: hypothetical protein HDS59_08365 [Barnesiella sp.]|nr:hypothetical protein [Barnesiella sp.]
MTLRQIYERERQKPTAVQSFVDELCQVTAKTPVSVYRWVTGRVEPDELTKRVLAEHLKTTPEELFPSKK